jgi:hypothetical protein
MLNRHDTPQHRLRAVRIIGLVLGLMLLWTLRDTLGFLWGGMRVEGTVQEVHAWGGHDDVCTTIKYVDGSNERIGRVCFDWRNTESIVGNFYNPLDRFAAGDRISVLIDPGDPSRLTVDDFWFRWVRFIEIFTELGAILGLAKLIGWYRRLPT